MNPICLQPSAVYVLKEKITFISSLMSMLADGVGGIEKLDTLIRYCDEYDKMRCFIPPIVEYSDFGEWMILDGQHRCFYAISQNIEIPILFISNVNVLYPCRPLQNGWQSVVVEDRVPKKKRYSRYDINDTEITYYDLHRDLSSFGSNGSRKSE